MAKITLNTILSGFGSAGKLTENFQKIIDELQNKVLYRNNPTGEPNTLETDIDMNSKRILNLPAPTNATEPARHGDINGYVSSAAASALAASNSADQASASAIDATSSATSAAVSATTATSVAATGLNTSASLFDFGLITDTSIYFPTDYGSIV